MLHLRRGGYVQTSFNLYNSQIADWLLAAEVSRVVVCTPTPGPAAYLSPWHPSWRPQGHSLDMWLGAKLDPKVQLQCLPAQRRNAVRPNEPVHDAVHGLHSPVYGEIR